MSTSHSAASSSAPAPGRRREQRVVNAVEPNPAVDTTSDLIAGWLGGAAGILVSNPLEVLKVRLQTARVPSNRVGRSSPPATSTAIPSSTSSVSAASASVTSNHPSQLSTATTTTRPGLASLWKSEGTRFLFAGAAGPILGLAFIDSAFFGLYGQVMSRFGQDRQDPTSLSRVFVAGATAGGLCAMLETPIEVVKCRAQVESGAGAKLGSFKIASMIARHEGLRGFYIGGLMTAIHDGISSGIFFCGYFVFRRLLRGESAFHATPAPAPRIPPMSTSSSPIEDSPRIAAAGETYTEGKMNYGEVGRILLAGGLAGALSAVVPYPFDIIKTRLQTSNFEALSTSPSHSHTSLPAQHLTIRSVARGIHSDGVASYRYRYSSTYLYSLISGWVYNSPPKGGKLIDGRPAPDPRAAHLTLRLLGFKGFATGIKPTVVSSFVGSAITITGFELALHWLRGESGGNGGVG